MEKNYIISEIKRIAKENNDKAPGRELFELKTGIKQTEWYPYIWLKWSDALVEAGFVPNKLQTSIETDIVIQKYIDLIKELGKIPVDGEIRRKARIDKSFPSHTVFHRFGGKDKLVETVILFCQTHPGNEDIISICSEYNSIRSNNQQEDSRRISKINSGFVYLMKSGKHYKIGRTNSVGRREREFAIQIPIPPKTIYSIETDDPIGVEAYWHNRFKDKRGEGEWFDLSAEDIMAFKRWKRIF